MLRSDDRLSLLRFSLVLLAALSGVIALSWFSPTAGQRPNPRAAWGGEFLDPLAERTGSSTDRQIEDLQNTLRENPGDGPALSQLGLAYLQKARENGDPTLYGKAQQAFEQALTAQPGDYVSFYGMGVLELARHQFQSGLEWGEKARQADPDRPYAYGVIADAQIELGRYKEAVQTLQTMVDLRPDMSSYARISYIRELHGDIDGAIEMMQWAVDGGSPTAENSAWTRTQLGNLYFSQGDLEQAEAEYRRTLDTRTGYIYALAGMGRVRAAQGKLDEAAGYLNQAAQAMPLPEFLIPLVDIYLASGQTEAAAQKIELLGAMRQLYEANGVNLDLEMALFQADHGIDPQETVEQARQGYARQPSIYAADVLAWALYQTGQYQEAQKYSNEALRLGTIDALKLFHAGMIAYRLGETAQARRYLEQALSTNPHFSLLHAGEARRVLEQLGKVSP